MRRLLEDADRTRAAYFRYLYKADADDPRLYHLTIDATAFEQATITDLIVAAAEARLGA